MDTVTVKEARQEIVPILEKVFDRAHKFKVITDDNMAADAGDVLKAIKQGIKTVEDKKSELVKPFKDAVKNLEAEFKPLLVQAETEKTAIEGSIRKYVMAKQARIEEENRQAREKEAAERRAMEEKQRAQEAEAARQQKEKEEAMERAIKTGDEEALKAAIGAEQAEKDANKAAAEAAKAAASAPTAIIKPQEKSIAGAAGKTVTVDNWKHDVLQPDIVPREYCSPDDKKLRAAVQKLGKRDIPGVRIYNEPQIRSL